MNAEIRTIGPGEVYHHRGIDVVSGDNGVTFTERREFSVNTERIFVPWHRVHSIIWEVEP